MKAGEGKRGGGVYFLVGLSLCSTIPVATIGPSFIVWPSTSEIAAYLLLIFALKQYVTRPLQEVRTGQDIPGGLKALWGCTFLYMVAITGVTTLVLKCTYVYPVWSLFRMAQWLITVPYILFYASDRHIKILSYGLMLGALVNVAACFCQRAGFLTAQELTAHLYTASGSGYWGRIAEEGLLGGESIGVFSFSRIATGFFLAISGSIVFNLSRNTLVRYFLLIVLLSGIFLTGSRTGLFAFLLVFFTMIFSKRDTLFIIILSLLLFCVVFVYMPNIQADKVAGRFVGSGLSYTDTLQGRFVRHMAVFSIPKIFLFLGCGLGNIGSVLTMIGHPLATKFYRAHGFFLTYLGEVGIFGVILMSMAVQKTIRALLQRMTPSSWGILAAVIFSGFTDDFMIPSGAAGHLTLIVAIAFRMSLLPLDAQREKMADEAKVTIGRGDWT